MARILLDDPAHAGGSSQLGVGSSANDGTGDPLRTGGQKLKTWASDLNAMTNELYDNIAALQALVNVLGNAHNQVTFDGANDWLTRGANVFSIDPKSLTIYADFVTPEKLDTTQYIMRAGSANIDVNCTATTMQAVFLDGNFEGPGPSVSRTMLPSTHYRVCASVQMDSVNAADDGSVKMWLSEAGAPFAQIYTKTGLAGDCPTDSTKLVYSGAAFTNFVIGRANPTTGQWFGQVSDGTKVDGAQMAFVGFWASTSRSAAYITDPSIFFFGGRDTNLSIDLTVGGRLPAPLVAFGGTQTAANWNAGTNMGTAGTFTMNGTVT